MLSWVGSRCWTRMKAMPVPVGNASTNFLQASSPPAEAPIPTTGKSNAPLAGLGSNPAPLGRDRAAARCGGCLDIDMSRKWSLREGALLTLALHAHPAYR